MQEIKGERRRYKVDTEEIQAEFAKQGRLQKWVGAQLGIDEFPFSRMVRGVIPFPKEKAEEFAVLLGKPVEWALDVFGLSDADSD